MSVLDVISTPLREGRPDQPHRRPRKAVFNPRPSVRGDEYRLCLMELGITFQSTPLREGRLRHIRRNIQHYHFQSTPLREGRRASSASAAMGSAFQSTPLREGRPHRFPRSRLTSAFQSTPLREGRRVTSPTAAAPPHFQSTPLREGRRRVRRGDCRHQLFNPRPSVRGDTRYALLLSEITFSIHAPP